MGGKGRTYKRGNIIPHTEFHINYGQISHHTRVYAKFSKIYLLIGATDVYNVY